MSFPSAVKFSVQNKTVSVQIDTQTTFKDAFSQIKDALELNEPMENYLIINAPVEKTFNKAKIFLRLNTKVDPIYYVCKKNDTEIIEKFCENMFSSIAVEAFMLPFNSSVFMAKIHLMHQMISKALDENSAFEIVNSIPFEKFGDLADISLVKSVCQWFHDTFFSIIEKPVCHLCGKTTEKVEDSRPTRKEASDGAYTVWRYRCPCCEAITRFPRYLSVNKLIETHSGQSIEASVLLSCILNALGFPPRIICNMEHDTMWMEVYVENIKSYVHVDPIEGVVDDPSMYEKRGIKSRWIVAVGLHECCDVTERYATDYQSTIDERSKVFPEDSYKQIISLRDAMWKYNVDKEILDELKERQTK